MNYHFDQMIRFAEKRKETEDKHTVSLKEINVTVLKSRVIDYSEISCHPPLQLFVPMYTKSEMEFRFNLLASGEHCIDRVCQQYINMMRYPVLCGNAIYKVDIGRMVYFAHYMIKDFRPGFIKVYAFNLLMRELLKKHIPWSGDTPLIRHKYYPYSTCIISTDTSSNMHRYTCPLIVSYDRIDTNEYTNINKKEED